MKKINEKNTQVQMDSFVIPTKISSKITSKRAKQVLNKNDSSTTDSLLPSISAAANAANKPVEKQKKVKKVGNTSMKKLLQDDEKLKKTK